MILFFSLTFSHFKILKTFRSSSNQYQSRLSFSHRESVHLSSFAAAAVAGTAGAAMAAAITAAAAAATTAVAEKQETPVRGVKKFTPRTSFFAESQVGLLRREVKRILQF